MVFTYGTLLSRLVPPVSRFPEEVSRVRAYLSRFGLVFAPFIIATMAFSLSINVMNFFLYMHPEVPSDAQASAHYLNISFGFSIIFGSLSIAFCSYRYWRTGQTFIKYGNDVTAHPPAAKFCLTRLRLGRLPEGVNRAVLLSLSHDDLIALILAQHAQIEAQAQQISGLTTRIAELEAKLAAPAKTPDNSSLPPSKGQKPNLPDRPKMPRHGRPGVTRTLSEHADRIIEATLGACPHCAHALGPTDLADIHAYDHIDLPPLRPIVTRINRHRGVCPCCQKRIAAPAPEGFDPGSPFGPGLSALIIHLHEGQTTLPRLTALLRSVGLAISKRAVQRLLTDTQDGFLDEARDVLRAGLESAPWISVDDTGARHQAQNGFCTQIGNDRFTWFATRSSKNRLNFLDLLRAGHPDYVLNEAAFAYLRDRGLSAALIARLAEAGQTHFADQTAWQAYLDGLGIVSPAEPGVAVIRNPVQIATEGALWGSIHAHGLLREAVLLSDDAAQFAVGRHALCWVHAERLVHKLDTFTDQHRAAQQQVRSLVWQFYADLKDYRRTPTPLRRTMLRQRFDYIFCRRTGFASLDRLLQRLHANKSELLAVLDHPDIPLHTNGSENDIRCHVTRRKLSGGTRSDAGRDAFLGLAKTCAKQAIAFWDYLGSRIGVPGLPVIPPLADLVRCRGQPA